MGALAPRLANRNKVVPKLNGETPVTVFVTGRPNKGLQGFLGAVVNCQAIEQLASIVAVIAVISDVACFHLLANLTCSIV